VRGKKRIAFGGKNIKSSKSIFNKYFCGLNQFEDFSIKPINNGEYENYGFIITFDDCLMHDIQFSHDPLHQYYFIYKIFVDK